MSNFWFNMVLGTWNLRRTFDVESYLYATIPFSLLILSRDLKVQRFRHGPMSAVFQRVNMLHKCHMSPSLRGRSSLQEALDWRKATRRADSVSQGPYHTQRTILQPRVSNLQCADTSAMMSRARREKWQNLWEIAEWKVEFIWHGK